MGLPLQRLRELLPFSQPHSPGALSRPPAGDPSGQAPLAEICRLAEQVVPQIARKSNLHMRFKLLEEVRQDAWRLLPDLETNIGTAALPLPAEKTAAALKADNLLKRLAQAYADIARSIFEHHHATFANLLYRATERAMSLIARRQLLAYRAYALPSANSWHLLHTLYRMSCDPRSTPLNGETAPIEHEYLGALIFAFVEPNKLPRNELDIVHRCTRQLAAYAVVSEATSELLTSKSAEACFLVRSDAGTPGFPLNRLPAGCQYSGGLVVDCTQVLAALDRNLARQPGKAVQPELVATPLLLQSLRVAIGGRCARRFSRTKFRPRADLIGGLDQVIEFLDGHAYSRRALDHVNRHQSSAPSPSEWSLIDESPDGFRIRFIRGDKCQFGAGDIVALQPRESSRVHVCLVRRIASVRNRLELGLQLLSPQVSVVSVACNGHDAQRALFLHSLPAYGPHAGLITAPGLIEARQAVHFTALGRTIEKRVGRILEANEGLEFVTLDPLPH